MMRATTGQSFAHRSTGTEMIKSALNTLQLKSMSQECNALQCVSFALLPRAPTKIRKNHIKSKLIFNPICKRNTY